MNPFPKATLLVSIAAALSVLSIAVDTAWLTRSRPAASVQARLLPMLVSQLSTSPDLSMLVKASAVFVQSDRFQTESEMQVKAVSGNTSVTSYARTSTIVLSPSQFRAEIVFSQSGSAVQSRSIVVSDGSRSGCIALT